MSSTADNEVERSTIQQLYDLKKRIGKGAYGVVWKGYQKGSSRPVAIKKVLDAFKRVEDAQRTYREVVYLRAFRGHPNIVRLLHVHRSSGNRDLYLVFEYMELDLHRYISEGNRLKECQVRYILYQLLRALKYVHSGEVVHRDLKPSNVLLRGDCTCKLADFGLARSLHEEGRDPGGQLTAYVATRWYRAPELLVGRPNYGTAVDLWSLGCVLAEMVTGGPLFPGESTRQQLEMLGNAAGVGRRRLEAALAGVGRRPVLRLGLAGAGPDCLDLARRLLALEPAARPSAAQALGHTFVRKHRGPEPAMSAPVLPKYSDHCQLSVQEYRTALYSCDRSITCHFPAAKQIFHQYFKPGSRRNYR